MAVSKEELFAKYKQLKSEGVNITLMELKKQMEAETSGAQDGVEQQVPAPEQTAAPQPEQQQFSGFSAINHQPAVTETEVSGNTFTQPLPAAPQPSDYSSPQPSWTTTYSQTPVQEPAMPVNRPIHQYEVNEAMQNDYAKNFTSNFTYSNIPPQQPQAAGYNKPEIIQPVKPAIPDIAPNLNIPRTKYGVIGCPLGHSLSVYIHKAGFESLNLNYTYEILETPPETLVDRIKYLKYNDYAGFNVTIPLKLPITMFLDEIDSSADLIGAVNTVVINPDRTMKGYNTDVLGFRNAIPDNIPLQGKTVGILGTGGAARAAITAFALEHVKQIKIYTRNIPNSIELLNYIRSKFPEVEFNAFQIERIRDLSDIDILVNTTPIGMQGRAADLTPVEENELKTLPPNAIVYDVIYNPKKTILLKLAQKNGYKTINGVDMFIHQAVAAEKIWTGRIPDFKDMKIAALENL